MKWRGEKDIEMVAQYFTNFLTDGNATDAIKKKLEVLNESK